MIQVTFAESCKESTSVVYVQLIGGKTAERRKNREAPKESEGHAVKEIEHLTWQVCWQNDAPNHPTSFDGMPDKNPLQQNEGNDPQIFLKSKWFHFKRLQTPMQPCDWKILSLWRSLNTLRLKMPKKSIEISHFAMSGYF